MKATSLIIIYYGYVYVVHEWDSKSVLDLITQLKPYPLLYYTLLFWKYTIFFSTDYENYSVLISCKFPNLWENWICDLLVFNMAG